MTDTIFAAASGAGRAAVAVIRLSGPGSAAAVLALAGRLPAARRASLRTLFDEDRAPIDRALVLWFPGPGSYTGEDMAELHVHGSQAVLNRVTERLCGLGLRLAEPGEFSRRAFENGKLDLAQAEGVADLIDAETEAQRRQALAQVEGALSRAQSTWRQALVGALTVFEAAVDFPDEEVPRDVAARAEPILVRLIADLEAAVTGAELGERVRSGFRIALIGAPNAGKSTLLNALVGRQAAIVTPTPGTTRDIIEQPLGLGGFKVLLADTAGLREATDEIEAEGVRRARGWAAEADLRLWLVDGAEDSAPSVPVELRPGDICLLTKRDLGEGGAGQELRVAGSNRGWETIALSAHTEEDVKALRDFLTKRVITALSGTESNVATRMRHRDHLNEALERLTHALTAKEPELAAEDVRLAARALDRITGRIDPEAVLEQIFATFCIGK